MQRAPGQGDGMASWQMQPSTGEGAELAGPGLRQWGQQKTQEGVDMKRTVLPGASAQKG